MRGAMRGKKREECQAVCNPCFAFRLDPYELKANSFISSSVKVKTGEEKHKVNHEDAYEMISELPEGTK